MSGERSSARRPASERRGGGSADRSPSSPPWSPKQERAFALRDADPKKWTFEALAAEVDAGESSVRRWFSNRQKHLATVPAVPTTPIPDPTQVTAAVNGTAVHTS